MPRPKIRGGRVNPRMISGNPYGNGITPEHSAPDFCNDCRSKGGICECFNGMCDCRFFAKDPGQVMGYYPDCPNTCPAGCEQQPSCHCNCFA